jgi:hypothetical protein
LNSANEFWLNLHRLADAYDSEGLTTDERAANIVDQFRHMPPIAQRHVLKELRRLVLAMPDLYPLVAAAANEAESAKQDGQRGKTA